MLSHKFNDFILAFIADYTEPKLPTFERSYAWAEEFARERGFAVPSKKKMKRYLEDLADASKLDTGIAPNTEPDVIEADDDPEQAWVASAFGQLGLPQERQEPSDNSTDGILFIDGIEVGRVPLIGPMSAGNAQSKDDRAARRLARMTREPRPFLTAEQIEASWIARRHDAVERAKQILQIIQGMCLHGLPRGEDVMFEAQAERLADLIFGELSNG